ncbi:SVM family protein [Candidatus Phytoplasma fraxini]|uniref:SVM family protein n=1 Tax=Ash yellows phytoplasma TaxID=35780 RepID=A0ABZ2U960_ASHYP
MLKLKNQLNLIYLYLITFIGLSFILNNNQIMAMENNNLLDSRASEEHLYLINNKIWSLSVKKQELFMLSASNGDQKTKSILNKRYFCYINMMKNLEQQRNTIINRGYYNNPILYHLINDFNQQLAKLNISY